MRREPLERVLQRGHGLCAQVGRGPGEAAARELEELGRLFFILKGLMQAARAPVRLVGVALEERQRAQLDAPKFVDADASVFLDEVEPDVARFAGDHRLEAEVESALEWERFADASERDVLAISTQHRKRARVAAFLHVFGPLQRHRQGDAHRLPRTRDRCRPRRDCVERAVAPEALAAVKF
ncbi:hypothetical protein M885DRAFT_508777 [Pelagophyceae sp. CCMP2097]|nr:hypothetical protein M885DRAFT_508777 [Pelagophyceae sp. CCMP2097]